MNPSQPATFDVAAPLPTGTTVLEASAGTGKTYAIAALATRFIAEGVVTKEQLMLVTFSRAATQELRTRVRERLHGAHAVLSGAVPIDDRDPVLLALTACDDDERARRAARLADALTGFDATTIATTHEFCHRMVAGLGTLADPDPQGAFVEDLHPEIRAAVVDTYVARFAEVPLHERPFTVADAEGWMRQVFLQPGITIGPSGAADVQGARVDFCRDVRDLVEARRTERGVTTYDDMLTRLARALEHPRTGGLAARRLAERFPVVLIDEFQDTDPVQWEIVRRAFVGRSTVVLIGDPKQAIYGFRGADVYSYLAAVRAQPEVKSLGTNYRSDERVLTAVHELLGGAALGEEEIVVRPVAAAHTRSRLRAPAPWDQAVRIRSVEPADPDPHSWPPIGTVRDTVRADLTADIARLLASGAEVADRAGWRPVAPHDIAVLVSRNKTGEAIRGALMAAGIPAVCSGVTSVYSTPAARDWLTFLRALATQQPADLRAAALTSFVGWQLADLVSDDSDRFSELASRLRHLADVAAQRGMAALTDVLWTQTDIVARVLARPGGERTVTDLRHVGHNVQAAQARLGLSVAGLVDWLREQIDDAGAGDMDNRSQRLETDAEAVQIMTVHRSKGLEFPIVYLPEAGDRYAYPGDRGDVFVVHAEPEPDSGAAPLERMIDVGGIPEGREAREERRRRYARQQQEDAGDDLRKLYVALTRAQRQVTLWWIPTAKNLPASALQRALFRPAQGIPEPSYTCSSLDPVRERLAAAGVAVQPLEVSAPPAAEARGRRIESLRCATFDRAIDTSWRRTSYSALTSAAHDASALDLGGRELDEPEDFDGEPASPGLPAAPALDASRADEPSPMAELPGGTQFGSLIHAIFEHLDPGAGAIETQLQQQAAYWLPRHPVPELDPETLATALLPAWRTPLGPLAGGRTLADIAAHDRQAELDFELPLGQRAHASTLATLADIIEAHLAPDDALAAYPALLRAGGLGEQQLRGFLTGSIDALVRIREDAGRYIVIDYKTNRLAPLGEPLVLGHYDRAHMAAAMMHSHYPLQALLYAVATHRFLRWRLANYDPATHLGGVLYLFVRGMAGPAAPDAERFGVFDWCPPPELVVELSAALKGQQ